MYNFFSKQARHTPEPERKYGLYAYSYYATGFIASFIWVWFITASVFSTAHLDSFGFNGILDAVKSVETEKAYYASAKKLFPYTLEERKWHDDMPRPDNTPNYSHDILCAYLDKHSKVGDKSVQKGLKRQEYVTQARSDAREKRSYYLAQRLLPFPVTAGFFCLFVWLVAGTKWAIFHKPTFLPRNLYIWAICFFVIYGLAFVWHPASTVSSLLSLLYQFLPPIAFLTVPTYVMVLKEIAKETQFYQETLLEGRGLETGRWGGLLTYIKRDISPWFSASKKRLRKTKESPIYLGRTMWLYDYKLGGRDIGIISEQHLITISGTGAGKSRDVIFNNVLAYNGGMIAFDTKGEHVDMAYTRRSSYAPAYIFDPYLKSTEEGSYWNPLDEIDPNNPSARGDLKRIASAIIPREKGERAVDVHFREVPQKIIRGYIAHILTKYPKEKQHLGSLYDLFVKGDDQGEGFNPAAVDQVIKDMAKNDAIGGSPSDAAAILASLSDRDRSAHYTSISRGLDWVNDPLIRAKITKRSTFSIKECKTKNASIFLIIPEKNLEEMSRFLRLFYTVAFDTLDEHETKQPKNSNRRTLFLFDEFEIMGTFEPARQAALRKRSSFIKCWYVVQNFDQFKTNYPNLQDFFGNCDKQFFGIDTTDIEIRDIITKALGNYTVMKDGEKESVAVMSEGTLNKVLDAKRKAQIVIPVQGLPMRLRRVPIYKNFGRRYKTH